MPLYYFEYVKYSTYKKWTLPGTTIVYMLVCFQKSIQKIRTLYNFV